MEIIQRPHETIEGMSIMVLSKPDGKEVNLMTVCDFSREQAKVFRKQLEGSNFSCGALYANGGLPRDIDELLVLIMDTKMSYKKLHFNKIRGGAWQFWGDIPVFGKDQGFRFIVISEAVAYKIMATLKMSSNDKLKEFLACHGFKAKPDFHRNTVFFTSSEKAVPIVPDIFEEQGSGVWRVPSLDVRLELGENGLVLQRPLVPHSPSMGMRH